MVEYGSRAGRLYCDFMLAKIRNNSRKTIEDN